MKTLEIPAGIKVNIISRWINWSDVKQPNFKFIVEIIKGNERMTTEYGGGILAFIDFNDPKIRLELANMSKKHDYNVQVHKCIMGIRHGLSYNYIPTTNNADVLAIKWMFNHSQPKDTDILYALVNDNEAGELSFDYFCDTFGYDNDSRAAYKVWEACADNSIKLKKVIGHDDLDTLRELFQEY